MRGSNVHAGNPAAWPRRGCPTLGGVSHLTPLALALATVGVGSVLYHGPMPPGAELVHDGSIMALAAAVPLAWRRYSLRRPPTAALIAGAAAIVVNVLSRTGAPLCRPGSLPPGSRGVTCPHGHRDRLVVRTPGGPATRGPSGAQTGRVEMTLTIDSRGCKPAAVSVAHERTVPPEAPNTRLPTTHNDCWSCGSCSR